MTDAKRELFSALPHDPASPHNEPRAFSSEQLVPCAACLRSNAPTRANCLYCGAALPAREANAASLRPALKPAEEWEQGFNVVLLPCVGGRVGAAVLEEASALLRMESALLGKIVEAGCALPVARAASSEEAVWVEQRLRALNLKVEILSDETLGFERTPKRIRRIELTGEELRGWNVLQSESLIMRPAEIGLLVSGRIFTRRAEVEERRKRLRRAPEIADVREMFTDEATLDIFTSAEGEESTGYWRITAGSFDYACLGERRSLLARDNFISLTNLLRACAPDARFDVEYGRVRQLLGTVWPLTERTSSGGLKRTRPGKLNTEAVTTATNEAQFSRYARLLYHIELRRKSATP